jgi:hypothetical protein
VGRIKQFICMLPYKPQVKIILLMLFEGGGFSLLGVVAAGPVCGAAAAQQLLYHGERAIQTGGVLLQVGLARFTSGDSLSGLLCLEWCFSEDLSLDFVATGPVCGAAAAQQLLYHGERALQARIVLLQVGRGMNGCAKCLDVLQTVLFGGWDPFLQGCWAWWLLGQFVVPLLRNSFYVYGEPALSTMSVLLQVTSSSLAVFLSIWCFEVSGCIFSATATVSRCDVRCGGCWASLWCRCCETTFMLRKASRTDKKCSITGGWS